MKYVKRAEKLRPGEQLQPVMVDAGGMESVCGALVEFLTAVKWDDGSVRKSGTVLIVFEDGLWKAWLHDRDGKRSAWVSGRTPVDLASAIEEGFQTDSLGWRADRK